MSGGRPRLTKEIFAERSAMVHNHKYDYTLVVYVKNSIKVKIVCPEHGVFEHTPANHMNGIGCKRCATKINTTNGGYGSYHKKTTEQFTAEAIQVHGDKYDYSFVEYKNMGTKVKINCPEHGTFEQTAGSHLKMKCGCPECKKDKLVGGYGHLRFKNNPSLKDKPGVLYVISLWNDTEQFLKVGITVESLEKRFSSLKGLAGYNHEVLATTPGTAYELFLQEQHVKRRLKKHKYRPDNKFPGHTECFMLGALDELLVFSKGKK